MTANQPPPPPSGGEQPGYGTGPQPGAPQPGAGQPGWGQQPPPGWGQPPVPGQPGHAASGSGPAYGVPQGQPGHGAPPPPPPGYAQQAYGHQPAHGQQPGQAAGFKVDLKRLRMADYVVAGGALVYLVLALLPWVDFGDYFDVDIPGDSISGFSFSGLVSFSFILFLLAAAWAVLPAFADVKLGFPHSWVTVGLAGLGLLLTLVAWIQTLQYGFEICPLLALLVAVAITVFAVLRLLPELANRPALPGSVAGAAQWANQPAPGASGTGSPVAAPGQPYGGQPPAGQPYGGPPPAGQPYGGPPPAAQPYVQPQASPYGAPAGGPGAPGTAVPPPPPPAGGSSTGSTAAGTDPSATGGEPPRPGV